jgi:hypothetical protein
MSTSEPFGSMKATPSSVGTSTPSERQRAFVSRPRSPSSRCRSRCRRLPPWAQSRLRFGTPDFWLSCHGAHQRSAGLASPMGHCCKVSWQWLGASPLGAPRRRPAGLWVTARWRHCLAAGCRHWQSYGPCSQWAAQSLEKAMGQAYDVGLSSLASCIAWGSDRPTCICFGYGWGYGQNVSCAYPVYIQWF